MDFFINNILFIAIIFTLFLSIFLFIKYQKSSNVLEKSVNFDGNEKIEKIDMILKKMRNLLE